MTNTKDLVNCIVAASQEKKAQDIVTIDIQKLPGTICQYFVICTGNSPSQISAIADEIMKRTRTELQDKPITTDGINEARWIGLDYGTVIVHVLLPELRDFYAIEQLWEDGVVDKIPNLA